MTLQAALGALVLAELAVTYGVARRFERLSTRARLMSRLPGDDVFGSRASSIDQAQLWWWYRQAGLAATGLTLALLAAQS
ncbi:MAG: hypothetical protein AAGA90_07805 [Actinomycetota bacterium]